MCREDHTWAVFSPQKLMNSVSVFTANLCGKVASHGKSLWQSPHATCSAQSGRQIEIVVLRQWLRRTSLFANVRQTLVANAAHHCGKAQFDAYLQCGILAHGFLRLGCDTCPKELLLPFSGKRRGVCPSCAARRMAQTAAHLVECVITGLNLRVSPHDGF